MFDSKTLEGWIDRIQSLHPEEMEFDLERPARVFERLCLSKGLPYVISVAGTNGKGSCVELLSKTFLSANIPVGSYTSPHLVRFNERVCINGTEVADEQLIDAFERVEIARQSEPLTFFEYTTLAALLVFMDAGLEVLVLEAGLGGRLDVTNLIDADALLLTNITLDHMDLLGDSREQIGLEKAGLMRADQLVICGDRDLPQSVCDKVSELNAHLRLIGRDFDHARQVDGWKMLEPAIGAVSSLLPFPFIDSEEQLENAACVADLCVNQTRFDISESELTKGLRRAAVLGRQQLLSTRPIIILDVAHNGESVRALADYLQTFSVQGTVYALFAMLADKSIGQVLEHIIGYVDYWFVAELESSRAISGEQLAGELRMLNDEALISIGGAIDQWDKVQTCLKDDDLLIVFGSFLLVGDILGRRSIVTS